MSKWIALFGGSFNPVHRGHVEIVKTLVKTKCFNQVILIPNKNPPHKEKPTIALVHRLKLLKNAFKHCRFSGHTKVKISHFELKSETLNYAYHAIEYFRKKYKRSRVFFVLGGDAFVYLPKWYHFPEVIHKCNFVVMARKNQVDMAGLTRVLSSLLRKRLIQKAAPYPPFSKVFKTKTGTEICLLQANIPEVSSTFVREALGSHKSSKNLSPRLKQLLAPGTASYLKTHDLYANK